MDELYIFIDETKNELTNEEMYCAVMIENELCEQYRSKIRDLRLEIMDDPIYSEPFCGEANQKALTKSFHLTENSPKTRDKFWELIRYFNYECRIDVYKNVIDSKATRIKYLGYLNQWISQRYGGYNFLFIWERDSSLRTKWPKDCKVEEVDKAEDDLLAIPDYVLGIFRKGYYNNYRRNEEYKRKDDLRQFYCFKQKLRFVRIDGIKKPFTANNPYPLWKE